MANIAIGGATGAAGGALQGAALGGAASGPFAALGAPLGALLGGLVFGAAGAGTAALSSYLGQPKNAAQNGHGDLVETRQIRNTPVSVVYGRARLGGEWIACGYFDQVKDFAYNIPPGTVDYLANGMLSLCEGPIQSFGNFRTDGQLITHWLATENLPWQYCQYNAHYGTSTESLFEAQTNHANGYPDITPNPVPFRNTAVLQWLLYTGPGNIPRLPDINLDVVGPDLTIYRTGTTTDDASGDTAISAMYDGYSEAFYYTLSASSLNAAPFGLAKVGRRGGNRSFTSAPSGVSSVTKAWYLGKHDVLVMQDPSTSSKFYVGYWGIATDSAYWRTQNPSPDYANAILVSFLDERFALLHTLHDDGTTRYILRWNLLTGRVDRLNTDLDAATFNAICFSADLGAYVVASTTNLMVVSTDGETIRSVTSPDPSACLGVFVAGQQIGIVNVGSVYYYDFYTAAVSGPYGNSATDTSTGGLGSITSACQNTFTGHITVCRDDGSGNPMLINFIPSCIEDQRDINANGTSGTGTQAFSEVNLTGSPEPDFQLPGNLYAGDLPFHPPVYTGTGNIVGSQSYPPSDTVQDWCRDWSWRYYNSWNLTALQGNSSLAAAMWCSLVNEPCCDSGRWGAGLSDEWFSLSSFESVHSYCVGPITIINPDLQDTRVCERFKFDYKLESQTDISSLITQTMLVCCQGFCYTMGGILYVDVPRSGLWPTHHFSDRQTNPDSFQVNFISKADGVNRVRVVYRDVLDEYRSDYGEAEDLADINARGRVQSVEITADGCGRFASAQILAKQILDQSTAGRRQVTFKTGFIGMTLAPGDAIEVSNVQCGLNRMPARVMMVRESAEGGPAGEVEIQALETQSTFDSLDDQPASYAAPGDGVQVLDATGGITVTCPPGDGGNNITWLTNQSVYQAITYTIAYVSGSYAMESVGWKFAVRGYQVVTMAPDGTINILGDAPGVRETGSGWATLAAAEAANAGLSGSIPLSQPGPIGIRSPAGASQSAGISAPTGLTCTQAGTAGSTTYSYWVTAIDGTGETLGAQVVTATGNATLDGTNYNTLSWTAVTGASSYNVYGNQLGDETLMANVASGTTYNDTGADVPGTQELPNVSTAAVLGVVFEISS